MAFIRTKSIKGHKYAYLVENQWTKNGSRQKTKGYLGKIVPFGEHPVELKSEGLLLDIVSDGLSTLLTSCGFSVEDGKSVHETCIVDISEATVTFDGRPAVLHVNHGYICTHTLQKFLDFEQKVRGGHVPTPKQLASVLVHLGLSLDEDSFINLYYHIVPNKN